MYSLKAVEASATLHVPVCRMDDGHQGITAKLEVSPQKSAKTNAANDFDFWPFYPKIKGFPGLVVEHFYVNFGDPSYIVFEISCGNNRQTAVEIVPRDSGRRG